MSEPAHRVFALCATCRRDIARWDDGQAWWHLDGNIAHGHPAQPASDLEP